ncbi:MAG: DUF559 domain-containing protein, partial [Isosphaerales bacterium]
MTDAERRLWSRLRGEQFGGFKFRRQAPIGQFIVDFVCFERKIIVELDGSQHLLRVEEDEQRTKWLDSQGFRVLRFWNHEVFEDLDPILEAIWLALRAPPTLTLPHKGGGNKPALAARHDHRTHPHPQLPPRRPPRAG